MSDQAQGTGEGISPAAALSGGPRGRCPGTGITARATGGAGLGSEVCPSVRLPTDPEQNPLLQPEGEGENPTELFWEQAAGAGHPPAVPGLGAEEPLAMGAKHQKQGMFKSTDELAAGEQSRSFWLAAPEERGQGQPRGE